MLDIRERFFDSEKRTLSKYALLSENTKGRSYPLAPSSMRTEFMRDRDRIIHSESFRRLKDKTQVFISPSDSIFRTRLTHTLEVSQISRTISRALRLNEDLTEAIALGHDLGHTPFGHAGERALGRFLPFEHNRQSLRIVEKLEGGKGLNLTYEVRDGILNHKRSTTPGTLEGFAVNMADKIAYINHDIDDSLRAGIITIDDLPQGPIGVLGMTHGQRINTMITDIVESSEDSPRLAMSDSVKTATDELRTFMFETVYMNSAAMLEEERVNTVVEMLFKYYSKHPDELPGIYAGNLKEDGAEVCTADYIASMSDRSAVELFNELFVPHNWARL